MPVSDSPQPPAGPARFVELPTRAPAALYGGDGACRRPEVAFLVMHPDAGFIGHLACTELARRGYRALGVNSRFANLTGPTGGPYAFVDLLPDVAAAVEWLAGMDGVRHVVLIGHSGGGPLMAAYQNVAENGAAAFERPELLGGRPRALPAARPADGLVLFDSHAGYATGALLGLDPAIVDESRPRVRDPQLDMYDARNGFGPEGADYDEAFVTAYCQAQAARMARLVAHAERRLAALEAGGGDFLDDEPMVIPGVRARLWLPDTELLGRSRRPWALLHKDGVQPPAVVPSLRRPILPEAGEWDGYSSALVTSVRSFLATHAVRTAGAHQITADGLAGITWGSSFTSTPANLAGVTVPLLALAMTAHYFLVMAEVNLAHAASADRQLLMVRGALHSMRPCVEAETSPGEFGDTVAITFDHVTDWVDQRFG